MSIEIRNVIIGMGGIKKFLVRYEGENYSYVDGEVKKIDNSEGLLTVPLTDGAKDEILKGRSLSDVECSIRDHLERKSEKLVSSKPNITTTDIMDNLKNIIDKGGEEETSEQPEDTKEGTMTYDMLKDQAIGKEKKGGKALKSFYLGV